MKNSPCLFSTRCLLAAVTLLPVVATATTVNYDGTDPSLIQTHPIYSGMTALFPGASLTDNTVNVTGGSTTCGIHGGLGTGAETVSGNLVRIAQDSAMDPIISGGDIYGGYSDSGAANRNRVEISSGTIDAMVYGGFVFDSGTSSGGTSGNSVLVSGGQVNRWFIYGGQVNGGSGTATDNQIEITGGQISCSSLIAGASREGAATNNRIHITGGVINVMGTIQGGQSYTKASNNSIIIEGGTVSGNIAGGAIIVDQRMPGAKVATNNTVTIHATANVAQTKLYGGWDIDVTGATDLKTGNTLNLYGEGITVISAANFETYNFYLSDSSAPGSTVLTLTTGDTTDLQGVKVNVGVSGSLRPLDLGDQVTLIDASAGGISGLPSNTIATSTGMQGVTLEYFFDLEVLNNQLVATVREAAVADQSKALSEGFLSGLALGNQGADLLAGRGISSALQAARRGQAEVAQENAAAGTGGENAGKFGNWTGFSAMQGGTQRISTGSHVDLDGFSLLAGVAKGFSLTPGELSLAAFFEYGYGSFDTFNNFSGSEVRGSGHSNCYGGGVLARMDFTPSATGFFHAEAAARGGYIDNEYGSTDLAGSVGQWAGYDAGTTYFGLHAGAGYQWNAKENLGIDTGAQFMWTRQNGKDVRLTTGDAVSFEDADSVRLRLGSRATYAVSKKLNLYGGLAWEYEFGGDADASTGGYSIAAPSLGGSTGIGELGFSFTPFDSGKFASLVLSLGVEGYVGKREGVSGNGQINYRF